MVTAQREESVLASLNELRSIEQQRVDDERAARERVRAEAEAARVEADRRREAEAHAKREAEEAEVRRREDAERAAVRQHELAIALAEAETRAKAEAELAAARMAQELELRREQVRRTRPVLLFVVTGVLAVVGLGAAYIAMQRGDEIAKTNEAIRDANMRRQQAQTEADGLRRQTEASEATRAQVQKMLEDRLAELEKLRNATPPPAPKPKQPTTHHTQPPAAQPAHPQLIIPPECKDTPVGCIDRKGH
jgi:membrane protein involved in colicin uptake